MKKIKIGVIGLGYVGLPLALRFSEEGYDVTGFDIDTSKIIAIESRQSYIKHLGHDAVAFAVSNGFKATTDFSFTGEQDALIICVPTPLDRHREPDLSFVVNTVKSVLPYLRNGQVVSLESTTYPGTTEEVVRPLIESRGFRIGEDIHLVYSPEREDPGNALFSTKTIPKVVGGCTNACLQAGLSLYGKIIDRLVPVSSTRGAEMTKLLENIHRAVNIGLINEMKIVADRMGLDIYEIINAAASKPFGFVPYYPGPGLGGHCIPIDPFYLTWKAREYGLHTRFIELAGEINSSMPDWVIGKIVEALNLNSLSVKGSRVLVLGISYKKNIDDMRESPSVILMERLREKGAIVHYSDPWVPIFPKMREHCFDLSSIEATPANIRSYDLVLIATNHDAFDYEMIVSEARLVVDTRGVYKEKKSNVVRA